jgi:hypothetical protein
MEFDGRFQKNSQINFVVFNLVKELVIYENHQYRDKIFDNEIYLSLLSFFRS